MVMIFLQSPCLKLCLATELYSIAHLLSVDACQSVCFFSMFEYIWFTCWSDGFCVWNLLVFRCCCFCWSLGCALDCCPLSQHCPLDPRAIWLPLQATVIMATSHSHLFSIWLWHIHRNTINSVNLGTMPCTSLRYNKIILAINYNFNYFLTQLHLIMIFQWIFLLFIESQGKWMRCVCQIPPYV